MTIFSKVHMVCNFCLFFNFFVPKAYFESYRWGIIPLDFVSFPFRTSKLKNDINYIKYKFSHRFGKVCKWLKMYYSNIKIIYILKVTTMSIWIILKNHVWTYKECNFYRYWANVSCIHSLDKKNAMRLYVPFVSAWNFTITKCTTLLLFLQLQHI